MTDYAKRRLAELHAAAPAKRNKPKLYAAVRLGDAARACKATRCCKMMVYIWLVHRARLTGRRTVAVPNGVLTKYGVTHDTKSRALKDLQAAGLVVVEQTPRKTPLVTLL
jgi:hypothetical protein